MSPVLGPVENGKNLVAMNNGPKRHASPQWKLKRADAQRLPVGGHPLIRQRVGDWARFAFSDSLPQPRAVLVATRISPNRLFRLLSFCLPTRLLAFSGTWHLAWDRSLARNLKTSASHHYRAGAPLHAKTRQVEEQHHGITIRRGTNCVEGAAIVCEQRLVWQCMGPTRVGETIKLGTDGHHRNGMILHTRASTIQLHPRAYRTRSSSRVTTSNTTKFAPLVCSGSGAAIR